MKRPHRIVSLLGAALVLVAGASAARGQEFLGKKLDEWANELDGSRPAPVRRGAAFALGKMGVAAESELGRLVKALGDSDPSVREAAAFAIGEIGIALANPYLEAVKARAARPSDPNARRDEERLRADCARGWDVVGGGLLRMLNTTRDPSLRRSAVFAVGGYGPSAAPARRALENALRDADAGVKQNAAWALGRLGPNAGPETVASLCKVLEDPDAAVRRDAAGALGEIGRPTAASAIGVLADCCRRDADANVRKAAIEALVNICGPDDRTAASALRALLNHADLEVARGAALAMGNIGGPQAAPAVAVLKGALRGEDPAFRPLAAAALANIGPDAAPAVPELSAALTDPEPAVRRNVALALGRIGPEAKGAIDALARTLRPEEPDAEVRRFAAEALAHIGKTTDPNVHREIERLLIAKALPSLLAALRNDKESSVRQWTVQALFHIQDPEKANIVGPLTSVLQEKGADGVMVRYNAARCLALRMGRRAPEKAVDVLCDMLNDKNIRIYHGTDAKVSGGGEGQSGDSRTAANLGGDARFLAAQALARIGSPKANRKDVIDSLNEYVNFLRDLQQNATDASSRENASRALKETSEALAKIQGR
jgi:HEAT repeat protein